MWYHKKNIKIRKCIQTASNTTTAWLDPNWSGTGHQQVMTLAPSEAWTGQNKKAKRNNYATICSKINIFYQKKFYLPYQKHRRQYLKFFNHYHYYYFFFWLRHTACGVLSSLTQDQIRALAVRVRSPTHWTAREFPEGSNLRSMNILCGLDMIPNYFNYYV